MPPAYARSVAQAFLKQRKRDGADSILRPIGQPNCLLFARRDAMTWPGRGRESAIVANKLRKKRPLRTDGAYLRQCFGVGADNILVRLTRPIEHFSLFEKPRAAQAEYNNRFAGRPAGSTENIGKAGSRMRVNLDGHLIYLDLVFKALGTTPALGHAIPSGVEAMAMDR